jgi:hypothetical protein
VLLLAPLAILAGLALCLSSAAEEGVTGPVCAIAVLTALCLPGLLPFDFRGDVDNMWALKTLPIPPRVIVIGQMLVPVALLSLFQFLALMPLAMRGWHWTLSLAVGALLLVPVNFIIIGLENLVFLLYPYRLAEFDMHATVRRMVMLMAKFLALGIAGGIAMVTGLGVLVVRLGVQQFHGLDLWALSLYQPLLWLTQLAALAGLAAVVLRTATWAYCRYDLYEDAPG